MIPGLFDGDDQLQELPLPDAELKFTRSLALNFPPQDVLRKLIASTPWRAEKVTVWGKTFDQPRLIAWYGDAGRNYSYSGIAMDPLPWTDLLRSLLTAVERVAGVGFNSVLLNYYRNENDSMGFHSDDERELGPRPTIASLSFGAERTFIFKHKTRKDLKPFRIRLPSGSLLLMQGVTQSNWKHAIEKERQPLGPRVNLTFRQILDR